MVISSSTSIIDNVCDAPGDQLADFVNTEKNNVNELWWDLEYIPLNSSNKWQSVKSTKYKVFFSIVVLVICDAQHCFSFTAAGEYGGYIDSEIFIININIYYSEIWHLFHQGNWNIPACSKTCESYFEFQYFLVRDIFTLHRWLM